MTIFEEILGLLSGSPELHAYLLARPEQLQTTDYAHIIAGAPVALMEKKRLLDRLSGHMAHSKDTDLIRDYNACLHMALQALESKDAAFSAELWKDGEQLDGPYIAFSMEEAQRAIAQYRKYWEENADDEIATYWRIEQYRQGGTSDPEGFACPEYTFAAAPNGEVQYFMHDPKKRRCVWAEGAFGGNSVHLNLPVPYRPGDILEVGCAPYVSEPHYCILTEVGDDCCGVQCLYPGENGHIEFGALKHGHYFSGCFDRKQYLSPLYGAKIYTGELSGEYKFMKPLSEKLHKSPAFGKVLWEIGHDLGFSQPQ